MRTARLAFQVLIAVLLLPGLVYADEADGVTDKPSVRPPTTSITNTVTCGITTPADSCRGKQDTARYETWLQAKGKEPTEPREVTSLRIGDWGFFTHGSVPGRPGRPLDRAGLDKANHAIEPGEKGDWYVFLTTKGLDAAGALHRVAWLFGVADLTPADAAKMPGGEKVTAPTLIDRHGWNRHAPGLAGLSAENELADTASRSGQRRPALRSSPSPRSSEHVPAVSSYVPCLPPPVHL